MESFIPRGCGLMLLDRRNSRKGYIKAVVLHVSNSGAIPPTRTNGPPNWNNHPPSSPCHVLKAQNTLKLKRDYRKLLTNTKNDKKRQKKRPKRQQIFNSMRRKKLQHSSSNFQESLQWSDSAQSSPRSTNESHNSWRKGASSLDYNIYITWLYSLISYCTWIDRNYSKSIYSWY